MKVLRLDLLIMFDDMEEDEALEWLEKACDEYCDFSAARIKVIERQDFSKQYLETQAEA